jgi:hypothetical protein
MTLKSSKTLVKNVHRSKIICGGKVIRDVLSVPNIEHSYQPYLTH